MSIFSTTMLVFAPCYSKTPKRSCLYSNSCGPLSLQPVSQTCVPTTPLKLCFVSPKNISGLFFAKVNGQLSILTLTFHQCVAPTASSTLNGSFLWFPCLHLHLLSSSLPGCASHFPLLNPPLLFSPLGFCP